ncbi:hypothetical protein BDZ89DRAFT_1164465 [Hymenopellis radicata]|nr:hypothetical protein BDZ89DRAFT_1164465 [Hymenopellis radicata]
MTIIILNRRLFAVRLPRPLVYKGRHIERGHPSSFLLPPIMSASLDNLELSVPSPPGDGLGDDAPKATMIDADKGGAPLSCSETRALVHQYMSRNLDRFHSTFPFLDATHYIFIPNAASRPEGDESDTESQDGVRISIQHTFPIYLSETEGHLWLINLTSSSKDRLASVWIDARVLGTPPSSGKDKELVASALKQSLEHGRAVGIVFGEPESIHSVAQEDSERETWQDSLFLSRVSDDEFRNLLSNT